MGSIKLLSTTISWYQGAKTKQKHRNRNNETRPWRKRKRDGMQWYGNGTKQTQFFVPSKSWAKFFFAVLCTFAAFSCLPLRMWGPHHQKCEKEDMCPYSFGSSMEIAYQNWINLYGEFVGTFFEIVHLPNVCFNQRFLCSETAFSAIKLLTNHFRSLFSGAISCSTVAAAVEAAVAGSMIEYNSNSIKPFFHCAIHIGEYNFITCEPT